MTDKGRPIVVDLDGTLVFTDMLHELTIKLFARNPLSIFQLPLKLLRGKAALKQFVTSKTEFSAAALPYNSELIEWLKIQKEQHKSSLVLCTAADIKVAKHIATHVGLFDDVMASDGKTNLSGENKAQALIDKFGAVNFDYCGNANIDLLVWKHARSAIVVNADNSLVERAKQLSTVSHIFTPKQNSLLKIARHYLLAIKTVVFLLALGLLHLFDYSTYPNVVGVCVVYLLALAIPIARDLFTLESSRLEPKQNPSPFASGESPIVHGVMIAVILAIGITACGLGLL